MKRTELCNIVGCGGRLGTEGKCNHEFHGKPCPSCGYELIKNTVSESVYCGNCDYHMLPNTPLGKAIKSLHQNQ